MVAGGEQAARFAALAWLQLVFANLAAQECLGKREGKSPLADSGGADEEIRACQAAAPESCPKSVDDCVVS
jgi:hypothetical protein